MLIIKFQPTITIIGIILYTNGAISNNLWLMFPGIILMSIGLTLINWK